MNVQNKKICTFYNPSAK